MVHTDAPRAFHPSFCLTTEHTQASIGPSPMEAQICHRFVHKEGKRVFHSQSHFPFLKPCTISGLRMSSWGGDTGSKMHFLSPTPYHPSTSVDSILTHSLRNLQVKLNTHEASKERHRLSQGVEIAFRARDFPHVSPENA